MQQQGIVSASDPAQEAHAWVGAVLDHFARGEQALGQLSLALGLSIANGSLGSLKDLRQRLSSSGHRKALMLDKRVARWLSNRPFRHLLAHGTVSILYDAARQPVIVSRHLPCDSSDVSLDRVWTRTEQAELLRQACNDGRSIADLVRNVLEDQALLSKLRTG